uniref:Vacuolar protein sorting-associated protein 18 homolog n=1 Tax=Elaeophora elaphi TaxID=1147741 RepID=A0A0R3RHG7_9BILA
MKSPSTPSSAIFIKKAVDFRPKGQITHLCSSNGEMLLVIGARQLLHYPLQNTSRQIDVVLPLLMHDRIAYVHLSPNGRHAIISTTGADNFYLNLKHDSAKQFKKLKGHVISSVGWNMEISTDNETGFIVLGTTKGFLFESSVISNGTVAYVRELTCSLSGIKDLSVTGIEMCQCEDENQKSRWALFVCLPGRLYCLSGLINTKHDVTGAQPVVSTIWSSAFAELNPAILQPLFASKAPFRFHSMDDGQRNLPSTFVVYPKVSNELPTTFCWVGADGYTLGRIDLTVSEAYDMIVEEAHIQHQLMDGRYSYPLDVALTEYNVLLLYSNHIEAISLLNQKLMFDDTIGTDYGQVKGMCRDAVSEMVWVYTDVTVWKYRPNEEFRDIWQIYLERGEYGKARAITNKLSNPAPHQLIIKKEAEKYIAEKNFTAAAEILMESTDPFEVILLKFLSTKEDRRSGLKRFLELKLKTLTNAEDKIRRDALVLWLLEVQLTEFAELRRNGKQLEGAELASEGITIEQQIKNMRQQIEQFLAHSVVLVSVFLGTSFSETVKFQAAVEVNRDAVYHLITSHAHFDIQLYLAQKLKDYATIVNVYLLQSEYEKVLEVIQTQHILELYYKHSSTLIEKLPSELIAAWIEEGKALVSDRLLPALYRCQDVSKTKMVTAALKYLNFVINENWASRAMHNFMITLCAEFKPEELLNYFEKYGYDRNLVPYDVEYALRVCIEKQALKRCCVFMYCVDELYDEAVSLALTIDVELAKTCAKQMVQPNENEYDFLLPNSGKLKISTDMRRRVWLQIARHVIEKQKDIAACVSLLKESNNTIKIQDLLPFFPEFTTIEYFKGPLCECLKEHSGKIKVELFLTTVQKIPFRFTIIRSNDQCASCSEPAMTRPFYAFACRHFFHKDCLESEMKSHWTLQEQEKYSSLVEKEGILQKQLEKSTSSNWESKKINEFQEELEHVRNEINDMIAGDCIFCGIAMINSIDKPFFDEDEYEKEMTTW